MVRVDLFAYNTNTNPAILDFHQTGDLVQPLNGTKMFIRQFSIPNGDVPLVQWKSSEYTLSLKYKTFQVTRNVVPIPRGTSVGVGGAVDIYWLQHIASSITNTLRLLMTDLDVASGHTLPTTVPPYCFYKDNYYSLVAPIVGFDSVLADPIVIYMNSLMFKVLQTIDAYGEYFNPPDFQVKVIFENTYENTYNTTYLKNTQTSISLTNYAWLRAIIVTTVMPIESEIVCSTTNSSRQSAMQTVALYTVNYGNGSIDVLTNNDFVVPVDQYRMCPLNGKNVYSIKCKFQFMTSTGEIREFSIPGKSVAIMTIEIL